MARKALSLLGGGMNGVNTMLNVINTKENMEDRKYLRGRRKVLDTQQDEDRLELKKRTETSDLRTTELHTQNTRINELNLSRLEGDEKVKQMQESLNLLDGLNAFVTGQDLDRGAVSSALNHFISPYINRGNPEGSTKRIIDMHPDESGKGVYVDLEVTPKNGEAYKAPLTRNQSDAADDGVALVPYDDLFSLTEEVIGDLKEAGMTGTNHEIADQLREFLRVFSGDKSVENAQAGTNLENLKLNNKFKENANRTDETIRLETLRRENGFDSGSDSTPMIRNTEYLADILNISKEQAFEMQNGAKNNPTTERLRIFEMLVENQANEQYMTGPERPVPMNRDQMMTEANRLFDLFRNADAPQGGGSNNSAENPASIASDEEYEALAIGDYFIDPEDGSTYRKQ